MHRIKPRNCTKPKIIMKTKINYNSFFLLLLFLLPATLMAQSSGKNLGYFELKGTLNEKDGTVITLNRDFFGENILVARDTIRDKQFKFELPVDQITIGYLVTKQNRMINTHTVIIEPGK